MTPDPQIHDIRVSARTARLTASADDGGEAWRFGGVAVGEGDILHADDGTPVLFDAETLEAYAETQADEPLSVDHPEDESGQPIYPPPVENSPGKVLKAGYVPGQGLVYEARTHDEEIAKGIKAGNYEVSVHPNFALGEKDPETGAYKPSKVDFKDLSIVTKGMSASNTAEWGPNHALAKWTEEADISAEIEAVADGGEDVPKGIRAAVQEAVAGTLDAVGLSRADLEGEITAQEDRTPQTDDAVRWDSDGGSSREPSDVRYGVVVNPLEDDDEDKVLVSIYQADPDYDGWENKTDDEERMSVDTLEVVGTNGVESLPPISQVFDTEQEASASAGNEPAEPGAADDDPEDMTDPEDDPENDTGDDPEDEQSENTVTVDIGEHDDFDSFLESKVEEVTANASKSDKVDEIIANHDDYEEDDREELMASADKIVETLHDEATAELTASLPGAAGGRKFATQDDGEDRGAYGTGVSGDI